MPPSSTSADAGEIPATLIARMAVTNKVAYRFFIVPFPDGRHPNDSALSSREKMSWMALRCDRRGVSVRVL
jgi:hypothetical protein